MRGDSYVAITDNQSESLQLRLAVEGKLIGFYRLDNGQKLLVPDELVEALREETLKRQEAEKQAEQERQRATQLESMLARYREQFGELRFLASPLHDAENKRVAVGQVRIIKNVKNGKNWH